MPSVEKIAVEAHVTKVTDRNFFVLYTDSPTIHIGAMTREAQEKAAIDIAEQVLRVLGRVPKPLNRSVIGACYASRHNDLG